ncbi:MAG TPA: fenitrothion hydrolase [Solirubrobacteraceae bacterium]|nr:fenitrothion hydrolase [Solirubrobacteraceae bacterium]
MPFNLTLCRARDRLPAARRATLLSACLLASSAAWPVAAEAHGVSGRASLPVPAWLFAWAAAIVLVVSFVLLSAMWSRPRLQQVSERRACTWPEWIAVPAGLIGLALFALVIYAGYDGVARPSDNFDPTFVFIVFWVALPLSSGLLGNWFSAFSPWRALARAVRWAGARVGLRRRAPLSYPAWLGRWPVVASLIGFAWLELVYHDRDNPTVLASLSLAYFALMLLGMALFGIEQWSERGDAFGGYFGLLARLSGLDVHDGALWRRRPLSALSSFGSEPGAVALVLVIIGITTFDGASNGVVWNTLQPHVQSWFTGLGLGDTPSDELADSLGMLLAIAVVAGFYWLGVLGMRSVSPRHDARALARSYAHTLVPIGFAYVLAHYFSLLVWQGQAIGYLASNPLGHGSDYFGTAHWHVHYGWIGSTGIWYVQVVALIAGHVCGLALAHDRALARSRSSEEAVRSQYWMLVVMVGFTSLGLWLLSSVNT